MRTKKHLKRFQRARPSLSIGVMCTGLVKQKEIQEQTNCCVKIVVQISEIVRPTNRSLERFGFCQVNSQASKLGSLRQFLFPVNLSCFVAAAKLAK